jgi:hypothetical protein
MNGLVRKSWISFKNSVVLLKLSELDLLYRYRFGTRTVPEFEFKFI